MSQHPKFKPGDVVKLMSGSPRMTVRGEAADGDSASSTGYYLVDTTMTTSSMPPAPTASPKGDTVEAGAPDEIEVTNEMRAAGAHEVARGDDAFDSWETIAERIFRAMIAARPTRAGNGARAGV